MATHTVTSHYTERCKPYRVRMACGHVETRLMREATAGIPWTTEAEIVTNRADCAECRRARGES